MSSNVTFVTGFLRAYDVEYESKREFDKRLDLFLKIADTGVNICVFIDPEFKEAIEKVCQKYNNIKLLGIYSVDMLKITSIYSAFSNVCNLPEKRYSVKDTANYMLVINSKTEFVREAIELNPFSTEYFCWLDFSLPHVFKHSDKTIEKIKILSQQNFVKSFLVIPGCWNFKIENTHWIKNQIVWRFAGGVFMGDKKSLVDFSNLCINTFQQFLESTKTLVWEVNYWAWLEANKNFNPIWCQADHNDSIVDMPQCIYE